MPISQIKQFGSNIDIVFCVDMTCPSNVAEQLRNNLPDFYARLGEKLFEHRGMKLEKLRVRFVLFKDYKYDPEAMEESQFFLLNEELDGALAFLDGRYGRGGGDCFDCAYEGLALAVKSEWTAPADCHRRIICMATDCLPKALGEDAGYGNYPIDMPKSLEEISDIWYGLERPGRNRIMLYAPSCEPWLSFQSWEGLFHTPVVIGNGCSEIDIFDTLVDLIAIS